MITSVIRAASAGKHPGLPLTSSHAAAALRQVSSSLAGEAGAGEAPPPPRVRLQVRDTRGALHDYAVPRAVRSPPRLSARDLIRRVSKMQDETVPPPVPHQLPSVAAGAPGPP